MKLRNLFILGMCALAIGAFAQSEQECDMKRDFESGSPDFFSWNEGDDFGTYLTIQPNPAKDAVNPTNNCLQWQRGAGNFGAGLGTWTLTGSAGYDEMKFMVYQDVDDGLNIEVAHEGGSASLGVYPMSKGVWTEITVPIPKSGFSGNVVFMPAIGSDVLTGFFYIDEIQFCKNEGGVVNPDDLVVLFSETFGAVRVEAGGNGITANAPGALDAGTQHYFPVSLNIYGNWSDAQPWPGASGDGVLVLAPVGAEAGRVNSFTIQKINTKGHRDIALGMGVLWQAATISYSTDQGTSWTDTQFGGNGAWDWFTAFEDLPAVEDLWIKLTYNGDTGDLTALTQIDDITITGYFGDAPPVDKTALQTAIAAANAFISGDGTSANYCAATVLAFSNGALETAKGVYNSTSAKQADVNAAITPLNLALNQLKATALDFSALEAAIAEGEEYAEDANVAAAVAAGEDLIATGNIDDTCATQGDVAAAAQAIFDAIDNIGINGAALALGLSPNPAGDHIQIAGAEGSNVYIFNAAGQQVLSVMDYNGDVINVSALVQGVYTAVFGKQAVSFIKK